MYRRSFIAGVAASLFAPPPEVRRVYSFPSWPPRSIDSVLMAAAPLSLRDIEWAVRNMQRENACVPQSPYEIVEQSYDPETNIFKVKLRAMSYPKFIMLDFP